MKSFLPSMYLLYSHLAINDLMTLAPFKQDDFPAVPGDVKVGTAPGVYGRYEGHSDDNFYDRLVPWGDNLNEDRFATCPFVQDGIDIQWVRDNEVWVESWNQRPTTWAKVEKLKEILRQETFGYKKNFNSEGQALIESAEVTSAKE